MSGLVRVTEESGVVRIALNRPDVRNALSGALLFELQAALAAADREDVRLVVLAGEGRDFCAGADLADMRRLGAASPADNRADAEKLGAVFRAIHEFPRPVLARVQGNVFGGGCGLVAAADVSVVAEDARFAFSEVRLGILPAVIAPYVIERLGVSTSRRLFLTGERFDGRAAGDLGLADRVVAPDALDDAVDELVELLLLGSPDAQRRIKLLVDAVASHDLAAACGVTPHFIADARASEQGQEGLRAFFEKRRPAWAAKGRAPR